MSKRQLAYSIIGALIAALALDVALFLVQGADALSPAPASFDAEQHSGNGLEVAHYRLDWLPLMIETTAIFALIIIIRMLRGRRTQ